MNTIRNVSVAVTGCFILCFLQLDALPFLDLPNHSTRAYLIFQSLADVTPDSRFHFEFHFLPYILGDLLYAGLFSFLDFRWAPRIWMSLIFLSFILGVFSFQSARKLDRFSSLLCVLLSTFFASSWHFLSGYTNYCLSIGLAFVGLALLELFLQGRRSLLALSIFLLVTLSSYLLHLAGFFFFGIIVATILLYRSFTKQSSLLRCALAGLPFLLLVGQHVLAGHLGSNPDDALIFRSVFTKVLAFGSMFARYNFWIDGILLLLLSWLSWLLWQTTGQKSKNAQQRQRESFFVCLALGLCFLVLPAEMGPTSDVDNRALPFLSVFILIFLCERCDTAQAPAKKIFFLASTIAFLNFLTIGFYLNKMNLQQREYLEVLAAVPEGKHLLPIATTPDVGRVQSNYHAAELYLTRSRGLVPYVFSKNTSGDQFAYFGYNESPYTPPMHWYLRLDDEGVHWEQIVRDYDYVIVTNPFDRNRLKLRLSDPIAQNSAATLFAVSKTE